MKHTELRRIVDLHFNDEVKSNDTGLSAFARWLNLGNRTVMRWASGEIPVPPPVARLLQVIDKAHVTPAMLAKIGELEP